jgi:hypothetical protein
MEMIDRAAVIVLLDRLGSANNDAVLTSARELHAMVNQAGTGWDELLRPPAVWPGAEIETEAEAEAEHGQAEGAESGDLTTEEQADATRLIERLLTRKGISDTLREDLGGLKEALRDGTFDRMDLRYVRALARRLGA